MSAKLDPISTLALLSAGLQAYADIADRLAQGTITDEDIAKMLAVLGTELDAWQAQIDAHKV